ncbi:GH3 auxin-responsive promoter family protein [Candidatus Woesearchaeota archaeon]|nr:GH3 auxin-responsive promoter family protein [Candidatus Woesearchaeota archaeon]
MHIPRLLGKSRYVERYLASQVNPKHVQKFLLAKILIKNRKTTFGKEHEFKKIRTTKDFQKNIPISKYEDYLPYIEEIKKGKQNVLTKRKVKFFATTSGTTNEAKYIPITKTRIDQFREEFAIWSVSMLKRFPKLATGKTLYFAANSSNGFTEGGIEHGNISGYVTRNTPKIVKKGLVIPDELMDELDFEKKMFEVSLLALDSKITQIGTASPIQAIIFIDYLQKHKEELLEELTKRGKNKLVEKLKHVDWKPINLWPDLMLISCIKTETHGMYIDELLRKIGKDIPVRDPGIFSSEGRISLGVTDYEDAGVIVANENFFEFQEYKNDDAFGEIKLIDEVEKGKKYKIIMTTQEGLYRYDIEDIVEIIDFKNKLPIVRFAGRNKWLNIAEEHAPQTEIIKCAQEALKNISISGFTVTPFIQSLQEKPRYELIIELTSGELKKEEAKKIILRFDNYLQQRILTYKETRNEFGRMKSPILSIAEENTYTKLNTEMLAKAGQAKPIQVSKDVNFRNKIKIIKTYAVE